MSLYCFRRVRVSNAFTVMDVFFHPRSLEHKLSLKRDRFALIDIDG